MSDATDWFYAQGKEPLGPVLQTTIEDLIRLGVITANTKVWREGLESWEPAHLHFPFDSESTSTSPPSLKEDDGTASTPNEAESNLSAPSNTGADGLYVLAPSRSFVGAISHCLSNAFTYSGRASRSEFWFYQVFSLLAGIALNVLTTLLVMLLGPGGYEPLSGFFVLAAIGVALPGIAAGWRRLHDINRSGLWIAGVWSWLVILPVISLLGDVAALLGAVAFLGYTGFVIWLMVKKGDLKANVYG